MLALDRANYNGGQSREDRAVADAIHAAMASRYTGTCEAPDPRAGELVGFIGDRAKRRLPSLDRVDPDLAALIRALDHPRQEVRDVAAYTLGLLGPSAKDAIPFLEAKFGAHELPKGGWFNFAYGRVSCQQVSSADARHALPDALIPPGPPPQEYFEKMDALLVTLYRDPDYEYPPGFLSDNFTASSADAADMIARILDDPALSEQKRSEAAYVLLNRVKPEALGPALPALLHQINSTNDDIRFYVGYALVRLKRPEGVPLVAATLGQDGFRDWASDWWEDFCAMRHSAIAAEDKLIALAQHAEWPSVARRAVKALGCIGSVKSVPALMPMLAARDWQLNVVAAQAIGAIGVKSPELIDKLRSLSGTHWSSKVRAAANQALIGLNLASKPPPPPPHRDNGSGEEGEQVVVVSNALPGPFNHGLPNCDKSGRYSIDGTTWFSVRWSKPRYERLPAGFPRVRIVQSVGTQTFLPVPGGWLMGSDGFEDEGVLAFVSRSGQVQHILEAYHATIMEIVEMQGRYFAFGLELLKDGDAGSLFEIKRDEAGVWHAERILTLPSIPEVYAIAPTGELLLSDGPNDYAVVNGDVAPLKCETTLPGNYFDTNSEPFTRWP